MRTRARARGALLLSAVVLLAGCSTDGGTPPPSEEPTASEQPGADPTASVLDGVALYANPDSTAAQAERQLRADGDRAAAEVRRAAPRPAVARGIGAARSASISACATG